MSAPLRVLLVEDNPADARLVAEALRPAAGDAFSVVWEPDMTGGLRALRAAPPAVILLDMGLPESSGLETLRRVRAAAPALPIVVLTGLGDRDTAFAAIASGAQDFLAKDALDGEALARSLRYAVERQRLENEVSRLAALEREFMQNVCHELNTPLTCLCGSLQVLTEDAASEPGRSALLAVALRAAQHLADMVSDLSDGAQAEVGRLSVEPRRADAARLAAEAAAAFAGAEGARPCADLDEGLPPVLADPVRVRQVLNNLLGNARKFTRPGGAVRLRVRTDPADPAFLRFSVSDDGCGVPPEEAPRVFDRLYQGGPVRRGRKGLGIGLYLCRELVVRQGGRIWLESRPGEGATFSFTLPVFSLARLLAPLSAGAPQSLSLVTAELAPPPRLVDPRERAAARAEAREALRAELSPADVLLPDGACPGEEALGMIVTRRHRGAVRRLTRGLEAAAGRRAAAARGFRVLLWVESLTLAGFDAPGGWATAAAAAVESRLTGAPACGGDWRGSQAGAMLGRRAEP